MLKGAKIRRKSSAEQAASSFFASTVKDVVDYVVWDILLPSLKEGVFSLITGGASMALFGDSRGPVRGGKDRNGYTTYNSYYEGERAASRGPRSRVDSRGGSISVDDLTRDEAYGIRDALIDYLDNYANVQVKDLYELAGCSETVKYTDSQWGWYSLREMEVRPLRNGMYSVIMPPVVRLED